MDVFLLENSSALLLFNRTCNRNQVSTVGGGGGGRQSKARQILFANARLVCGQLSS